MSPIVVSYIGMLVAALILGWGIYEMSRRYLEQKRSAARRMNTWIPLKPTTPDTGVPEEEELDSELSHGSLSDIHLKAQQNGHYSSESKRKL